MNTIIVFIVAALVIPLYGVAQVEMSIEPMEKKIHIAEPVLYTVKVRNKSKINVTGAFDLDGQRETFRIRIGRPGNEGKIFRNDIMWDAERGDRTWEPITLAPDGELTEKHLIHFDARYRTMVFESPGEYEVRFNLSWDRRPDGGPVISSKLSVTSKVTVIDWDPKKDKRQIEALGIWNNAEVATFVQNMGKKTPEAEARLRRLKDEFGDTLYGGLAIAALEKGQEMEKLEEMKRARWKQMEKDYDEAQKAKLKKMQDEISEIRRKNEEMKKEKDKAVPPPTSNP